MRNYTLYKLLYYKYMICKPEDRATLDSNFAILDAYLDHKGIDKDDPRRTEVRKMRDEVKNRTGLNKILYRYWILVRLFCAIEIGPVSSALLLLYALSPVAIVFVICASS
ncbi:MAG: hypothetical protein P9M14_01280 [Candidatus Alcyoniella australis]|nr:hypothetical protein [Candidatus Alcyoniella australis]